MAWDLQIDLQTGDLVFNSIRDLASADAELLIRQRIHTRLMINRGEFIFDDSGNLGSRLRGLLDMGIPATAANISMIINEALAPMTDIQVTDVSVYTFNDGSGQVDNPRQVLAKIKYELVLASSEQLSPDVPTQLETQISLPA